MLSIEIANRQNLLTLDTLRLEQAAQAILHEAGITSAELSIALVDDFAIHQLNRQFLEHDYPTDVLSFVLECDEGHLEGEVIVSIETAIRSANQLGWPAEDETLLYVIHGTLHLVGHDDLAPEPNATMRAAEGRYLARFGLTPHASTEDTSSDTR
jgi:probable rRNA maturation factor